VHHAPFKLVDTELITTVDNFRITMIFKHRRKMKHSQKKKKKIEHEKVK